MKNQIIRKWSSSYKFSGGAVLLLFSLCVVLFFSCRKKIATDTTLERTSALGEKFKNVLTSSPQGWLVCIENRQGLHYNFYMEFVEGGRVKMKADFNEQSLILKESSYTIKLLQQPTLSFNTYNYISTLSDPDLGSPRGRGLRTDFEYALTAELVEHLQSTISVTEIKHFTLRGVLYQSKITFKRVDNDSDNKLIDKIIEIEKWIARLKYGNVNTLTVLKFKSKTSVPSFPDYHYDFRIASKIFAFTSLESPKRGAPMAYYFDICGEKGLEMQFANSKTTPRAQFVDGELQRMFRTMVFSDFSITADSTQITFNASDGRTSKQGCLTTMSILSVDGKGQYIANNTDSIGFLNNFRRRLYDIVEAGKSWDLTNNGVMAYEIRNYRLRAGSSCTSCRSQALFLLNTRTRQRLAQRWILEPYSVTVASKKYYGFFIYHFYARLYRLLTNDFTTVYRRSDSSQYLSDVNWENIQNKVFFYTSRTRPAPTPITLSGTSNVFVMLATTLGYQLHNVGLGKQVVIQYDL